MEYRLFSFRIAQRRSPAGHPTQISSAFSWDTPSIFYSYRKPYSLTHPKALPVSLPAFLSPLCHGLDKYFQIPCFPPPDRLRCLEPKTFPAEYYPFWRILPVDFLKLFLFLPGIHRSNLLMVSSVFSVHPISISYFSFIIPIAYLAPCFIESI